MATIISQIILALQLLLGTPNPDPAVVQQIYSNGGGGIHCNGGIVIIDTDEI